MVLPPLVERPPCCAGVHAGQGWVVGWKPCTCLTWAQPAGHRTYWCQKWALLHLLQQQPLRSTGLVIPRERPTYALRHRSGTGVGTELPFSSFRSIRLQVSFLTNQDRRLLAVSIGLQRICAPTIEVQRMTCMQRFTESDLAGGGTENTAPRTRCNRVASDTTGGCEMMTSSGRDVYRRSRRSATCVTWIARRGSSRRCCPGRAPRWLVLDRGSVRTRPLG